MFLFTRAVARDFCVLLGRCVTGRPRGPVPHLSVQIREDTRMIAATTIDGVTLAHTSSAPGEGDDLLVLPATVLAEVEGGTDEAVTLDRPSKLRGVVRWAGGDKPRALPVELILPGKQHELPAVPPLTPVTMKLLTALHECGRTAARESGRYALSKVQLQGKVGRVVGTDGKAALLCRGFRFPFSDGVLVPAVPVFGAKPLSRTTEVAVGPPRRTSSSRRAHGRSGCPPTSRRSSRTSPWSPGTPRPQSGSTSRTPRNYSRPCPVCPGATTNCAR